MPEERTNTAPSGAQHDLPTMHGSTVRNEFLNFEHFEAELRPELNRIHERMRSSFLFRAFELAKQKQQKEELRDHLERQAAQIRASIAQHKKTQTQIRKAIHALNIASEIAKAEDPELLRNLDVLKAQELLVEAEADLAWVISEMLPGSVHPKLRGKGAKPTRFTLSMDMSNEIPGFGYAQIDYWFIEELDKCLNFAAQRKRARVGRDRIIKKIFQIISSEPHEIERIKNARLRARKRSNTERKASK